MKCPNCGKSETLISLGTKYYYPVINENTNMAPSEALMKRYFILAFLVVALFVFGYLLLTGTYVPRGGYAPVRANGFMMLIYLFVMVGIGYLIKLYISEIRHINRVNVIERYSCKECSWQGSFFTDNQENEPQIIIEDE